MQVLGSNKNIAAILHHYGDRYTDYDERDLPCPEKLQKPWAFSYQVVKDEFGLESLEEDKEKVFRWQERIIEDKFGESTLKMLNEMLEKEKEGQGNFLAGPPFIEYEGVELKCST